MSGGEAPLIFKPLNPSGYYADHLSYVCFVPIPVAAWSKALIIFAPSNAGIVGSNPTQDMDVCVRLFCGYVVLCVGSGLATS
jgi:hypothetical protein